MIPWIQVYSNLATHWKTCNLRDILGLKNNYEAVGLLVCLWSWAAVNATDGDLTRYGARDIADATGYRRTAGKLLEALTQAGFLDRDADGKLTIHDWDEHAALLKDADAQQRKNTRERVRRYRERQRAADGECATPDSNAGCNVTGNASNAPTYPNLSLPNLFSGDGGESAGASEDEPAMIGLKPGEYLGVTSEVVKAVQDKAQNLVSRYVPGRVCTTLDCRKVFILAAWQMDGHGNNTVDADGLLEYAFEQAALNGKPGIWSYIEGILNRCRDRGIQTAQEAREWDEERPDQFGSG